MKIETVTVDTNILGGDIKNQILKKAQGLPFKIDSTSVSVREIEGTSLLPIGKSIPETGVWDESRWGRALWAGADTSELLETLLKIVSNGSFPAPGSRGSLSAGQRRQMRDVMILHAHIREERDIFVTNDRRAFVGKNGALRRKLESLYPIRIMTADEFCAYCDQLRNKASSTSAQS